MERKKQIKEFTQSPFVDLLRLLATSVSSNAGSVLIAGLLRSHQGITSKIRIARINLPNTGSVSLFSLLRNHQGIRSKIDIARVNVLIAFYVACVDIFSTTRCPVIPPPDRNAHGLLSECSLPLKSSAATHHYGLTTSPPASRAKKATASP